MSRVAESLHKTIIGRKFSKRKVKKSCWNCGFEWIGLQRSFCPRCKGGRLPPEKYAKV